MSSVLSSILPINSDNVFMAYNSNEFAWKTNDYKDVSCQSKRCSKNIILNPNTILITDSNSKQCYEKELCINKEQSIKLQKNQITHSGSNGRYTDSERIFVYTLLNTMNLGIGLIGILYSLHIINKK